jgi:hypothetical protein
MILEVCDDHMSTFLFAGCVTSGKKYVVSHSISMERRGIGALQ